MRIHTTTKTRWSLFAALLVIGVLVGISLAQVKVEAAPNLNFCKRYSRVTVRGVCELHLKMVFNASNPSKEYNSVIQLCNSRPQYDDQTKKACILGAYQGFQQAKSQGSGGGGGPKKNPVPSTRPPNSSNPSSDNSKANQYCSNKYPGGDRNSVERRVACRKAFRAGYKNGDKQATCKNYRGNVKTACQDAFDKGKEARPGGGPSRRNPARNPAEDDTYEGAHLCGNIRQNDAGTSGDLSDDNYYSKFDFGCLGEKGPPGMNPIKDLAFALLRFLSVGVGIAVILAVIGSGIQYSASEGNAEVTTKAKKRMRSAIIGLGVYIFAFSLFQFLVPGGIFVPGATWINIELIVRLL